jgi:hypothetical protein
MNYIRLAILLILVCSMACASVSWDGYILTIENDMVRIKKGAEIRLVCHISKLGIIEDKLVVEMAGVSFVQEINSQTKQAIVNELERNASGKSGK